MTQLVLPVRKISLTLALTVAIGALLAIVSAAPTGFAAGSTAPVAENAAVGSNNAYSKAAFKATNTTRRNHDRATLRGNACLEKAALRQARAMARAGEIFHQDLGRIQKDCGVGWVGENVAYGYPTGGALVRQGWMRSEGHRANILSRNFRLMGLAAVKSDGVWYAAQVFGKR